jgi:GNAT superfamily N-acetyltransferase
MFCMRSLKSNLDDRNLPIYIEANCMKVSQRATTWDNFEWLEPFYESIMRPYVELTHTWDKTKFREYFDPKLTKIIQVDGVDIGMLKVEERIDCIYLGDIQIQQEYRNKGIGISLIESVIRSAVIANKPLRLRVLRGNPAKNLYLNLGFREIEKLDNSDVLECKASCNISND